MRQNRQHLRFAGHTATHDFQVLCAGNLTGRGQLLAHVDIAYVVGLEARGLSPHARRVMESGEVELHRMDQLHPRRAIQGGGDGGALLAGRIPCSARIPFATAPPASSTARSPAERLAAIPALYPDVAAIHVHEADRYGNCRIRGTIVADLDLARSANRLIVTCERLIPDEEIRRDPNAHGHSVLIVSMRSARFPSAVTRGTCRTNIFRMNCICAHWLDAEVDPGRLPAMD